MRYNKKLLIIIISMCAVGFCIRASPADVLLDQPPSHVGGTTSDTGWYDPFSGFLWQEAADDFMLPLGGTIDRVAWYGFYGATFNSIYPPTGSETLRLRIYASRPSDGLPGSVLYEESVQDAARTATGQYVSAGSGGRPEYQYRIDLAKPFSAEAGVQYWFEIAQIDDQSSTLRWEYSTTTTSPFAVINEHLTDWVRIPDGPDLNFQLISIPEPALLGLLLPMMLIVRGRRESCRIANNCHCP